MPQIPPPLTEEEFKEAIRDCFTRGDMKPWSAHRGWKNRSSGSRALNSEEPQQNNLYEAYLDIYAARQVSVGLAAKVWDEFSRAVYPLIRPERLPAATSPLSEVDLYYNNWKALEHAREDGMATREECEEARKRALDCLAKFRSEESHNGNGMSPAQRERISRFGG